MGNHFARKGSQVDRWILTFALSIVPPFDRKPKALLRISRDSIPSKQSGPKVKG